jgi:hypothetical protein
MSQEKTQLTGSEAMALNSVSTATLKQVDLLDAYVETIEYCIDQLGVTSIKVEFEETQKILNQLMINGEYCMRDDVFLKDDRGNITSCKDLIDWISFEDLPNLLNEVCPPYFYFGAHPGDGADFGFWLSENMEFDFDGLKVSDTSEVKGDYSGEVLHVNDHGNMTLYCANKGELTEIWAIV